MRPEHWHATRSGTLVLVDRARDLRAVTRSPEVQGGVPVFAGTRVPVRVLFDHLKDGESLDSFLSQYPSVKRDQAVEVLEAAKSLVISER
jgi:uncharacterized protein (DUF433 family)